MASRVARREEARAAAARMREAERRRRLRTRVAVITASVVVLGGATAGIVAAAAATRPAAPAAVGAPPWPAPADTASAVRAAGLSLDPEMATKMHIHQKLRIVVDGAEVPVAPNIGVDASGRMASLHTHDSTGIVHVESATVRTFTLGQLFQEWRVPLADGRVGTFVDGKKDARVEVFVNGKKATGSPAELKLKDRQDIAVVVTHDGKAPTAPMPFDWSSTS